jgi:peptidoglycan/xylan/chitin deacetylase (PgdA/CDA1 family)
MTMSDQRKIVVFSGDLTFSVRKGIVEIDRSIPGLSWLVVVQAPEKSARQLLRNQWSNLRRNGWRWIPYQCTDLWHRLSQSLFQSLSRSLLRAPDNSVKKPPPGAQFSIAALAAQPNVRILKVADMHSGASLEAVSAFDPCVGISLAAPILRRALFAIPRAGTVNLHKGKVPDFRGMPPAFWELWNDEPSVGCTVHWVDDLLDRGPVAAAAVVEREPYSTLRGLQLRLDEVGVELMTGVIGEIIGGRHPATPQPAGGATYRKPTLAQMAALERKIAAANSHSAILRSATLSRRWAKALLGISALWLWRIGAHRLLQPRITVLLYHRVSDSVRDNLTVGIAQFERQMQLLRQHCTVLGIEEVLESHPIARSSKPLVCVTFDDGYLDNYLNAVPALLKHAIPAAFFVATGIIDSERRFAHDIRRGNPPIAMMQWAHLRKMHAAGFSIGSHTVNHVDCAAESADRVQDELAQSLATLRRELGVQDCIFGYPYGGKQHMTPERLELVKQAGYAGCLAAYGGTNIKAVDRFNVLRRGIHWECSDNAFLFQCVGLA